MKVKVTCKLKSARQPATVVVERSDFAARATDTAFMKTVDWLIADVCLTRWFYDDATGWWSAPRLRYVPSKPAEWPLTVKEMADRMKYSPNGFTQF